MKFSCDRCEAHYMISDEKVGPNGVKVRCKKCGNVISVRRAENGAAAAEAPAPEVTAAATTRPAGQDGLDDELGQAFDNAFGSKPAGGAAAAAPAPDGEGAASPPEAEAGSTGDAPATSAPEAAPPAAPPATEWYVAIGQAQVGPLPLDEVRRKWEGGDVGPDSLVWRPGMGDWAALSTVGDLAAYLAPFPSAPRPSRTPVPAVSPAGRAEAAPAPAPAAPTPAADVTWKPVGAAALAALASEELAARAEPEPRSTAGGRAGAAGGGRSLMDSMDLPDGGGVDPTGAIPLPIKALEQPEEKKVERRSSVARGAEELRHKRSVARGVALGAAAVVVLGGAAAAGLWYTGRAPGAAPAPAAVAQATPTPAPAPAAPAPAAAAPAPAEPTPAPAPAAEPSPAVAKPAQVAAAETAAPAKAEPEPARAAPASEPPSKVAHPPEQRSRAQREATAPRREPARVAQATPPPAAPAPAKKRDVLDFESNDAALDAALGGSKSGTRSVYVPPAPGGSALPDRVSDSQVNETILGRVSSLQQCVQEQKARDPEATGVLKMRWVIAPDGSVKDAKCVTPEFATSPLSKCLSGVLQGTRFPRSKSGRSEVTFPIKF